VRHVKETIMGRAKLKPVHGVANLMWAEVGERGIIKINATCYSIRRIAPDAKTKVTVYRLVKPDGVTTYEVHRGVWGVECTCADFTMRRGKIGGKCKHILALEAVTLIGADAGETR